MPRTPVQRPAPRPSITIPFDDLRSIVDGIEEASSAANGMFRVRHMVLDYETDAFGAPIVVEIEIQDALNILVTFRAK